MKKNKFLLKILAIVFSFILLTRDIYVAPPPGVFGGSIYTVKEKNTKFFFNLGRYSPSLNAINNKLKYYGINTIDSDSIYEIGIGFKNTLPEGKISFSYWSSSTQRYSFKETLNLYILNLGGSVWKISKFFPKPYDKIFDLNLNFLARNIFATLKEENFNTNDYIFYTSLTMDFGTGIELEFFPIKGNKIFSVSFAIDYILFCIPFLPFEVWDTNLTGVSVGDNYKDHNGKDIFLETQGMMFRFGVNLYF